PAHKQTNSPQNASTSALSNPPTQRQSAPRAAQKPQPQPPQQGPGSACRQTIRIPTSATESQTLSLAEALAENPTDVAHNRNTSILDSATQHKCIKLPPKPQIKSQTPTASANAETLSDKPRQAPQSPGPNRPERRHTHSPCTSTPRSTTPAPAATKACAETDRQAATILPARTTPTALPQPANAP